MKQMEPKPNEETVAGVRPSLAKRAFERRRQMDNMFRWVRSCAVCRSVYPPIDLLCQRCRGLLAQVMNRGEAMRLAAYPFPVYSLLTWTPETDLVIRPLAYAIKRGFAWRGVQGLVHELSFERRRCSDPGEISFLIPPRGRGKSVYDHAWLIGESMSRIWQRPLWDPFCEVAPDQALKGSWISRLSSPSTASQKQKGQGERGNRRFSLRESAVVEASGTRWVFLDDVITTGSTAMAAYMALGDPARFEVWTLIDRPKLAAREGF